QDISFQAMRQKLNQVVGIIMSDPAIDTVGAFTGGGGPGGATTNTGRMFVALKPLSERKVSATDVIARLRPKLAKVPGAATFLRPVQDINIGGRMSNALYQFTLQGDDFTELSHYAPLMLNRMRSIPQLTDINTDQLDRGLQVSLTIDRDTAARFGITAQMIDDALYSAFGQRQVSTMYTQLNQYHVVLEVAPQFWQSPDTLEHIYVHSPNGPQVPLSSFSHFEPTTTTLSVNHQGQFPAVTISFNLAPGVALGQAVAAIETAKRDVGLPASIQAGF